MFNSSGNNRLESDVEAIDRRCANLARRNLICVENAEVFEMEEIMIITTEKSARRDPKIETNDMGCL